MSPLESARFSVNAVDCCVLALLLKEYHGTTITHDRRDMRSLGV
jgi:hypothetical protein